MEQADPGQMFSFSSLRGLFRKPAITPARTYQGYEAYVEHQKAKTLDPVRRAKWLDSEWQSKIDGFRGIFRRNAPFVEGKTRALCLGARTGQEVVALIELGVPAIGIDLVPCPPHVEEGDIHELRFADASFDLLFTNVFDHSLYPDRFVSEMERVCRPGGAIILHLKLGEDIDEFSATEVHDPRGAAALFKHSDVIHSRGIDNGFDSLDWEIIAIRR